MITRDQFVQEITDLEYKTSSAVLKAEKDLDKKLREIASKTWEEKPSEVSITIAVEATAYQETTLGKLKRTLLSLGYSNVEYSIRGSQVTVLLTL